MADPTLYSVKSRLSTPRDQFAITCGSGWSALVENLNRQLADIDPTYTVFQVRQKFGDLQFCAHPSDDDASVHRRFEEIILEARLLAARTCEECGARGGRRIVRGWIAILCDVHLGEYLADV